MSIRRGSLFGALVFVTILTACKNSKEIVSPQQHDAATTAPSFTLATGSTSTLLGRASFNYPADPGFKIKRITGDWHLEIKSNDALDVAVQSILFQPGSQSGWHSHPGPVFIQVVYGVMKFYESDDPTCKPVVRKAGEGYLDVGDHAHIARNETADTARNVVTYFAPRGAALRIDEPKPGNCPF